VSYTIYKDIGNLSW